VPRPTRTIDPTRPLAGFASGLQALRRDANLTLQQLSDRIGRAKSVLSEAASGNNLPNWDVVEAYVQVCGGSVEEWRRRWEEASDQWAATRGLPTVQEAGKPGGLPPRPTVGHELYQEIGHRGGKRTRPALMTANDPTYVETAVELAEALNALRLRRGLSLADVVRAAERTPSALGKSRSRLGRSTVGDLVTGKSMPSQRTLTAFLSACEVPSQEKWEWLRAWERARSADLRRPAGGTRVREARPRMLGVHPAIEVEGAPGALPRYVARDFDEDLRAMVASAADHGGFVLVVGGSSVGKTRSLYEALLAVLPDWWLVHPADTAEVRALAVAPTVRTVLWLDELQRYLASPQDPTGVAGVVRVLVKAGTVLVGTMWPSEYGARGAVPPPGQPDHYMTDRDVLALAHVIDVPDTLSPAERGRVLSLASEDPRIRVALESTDLGFTQVIAGGPGLVRRWHNSPDPYARAVITAAMDARRLGVASPLTREMLAAAAPGYLTGGQRATAPSDWLDRALAYATSIVQGAVSALVPVATGMRNVSNYTIPDYLALHGEAARNGVAVPDTMWRALRDHVTDAGDLFRAGRAAEEQFRFRYAEALYSAAMSAGSARAGLRWADLLYLQDRTAEALEVLGQVKTDDATLRTVRMLVAAGRVDELRAGADAGDHTAAHKLVDMLARQGRIDELQSRADAGDSTATQRLAVLLDEQGQVEEAHSLLSSLVATGDQRALVLQAELLAKQGRVDDAVWMLRESVKAGDSYVSARLAELLADHGRLVELHHLAASDNQAAAAQLARLLAERGDLDTLRARTNAGDAWAAERLAMMLGEHSGGDETLARLRPLADIGFAPAAAQLAQMLVRRNELDELRSRALGGDPWAVTVVIDALDEAGDDEELMDVARHLARTPGWTGRRMEVLLATRLGVGNQERVGDRYRLLERVGSGQSGAVWRAYDEELGRLVAVKLLAPSTAANADFRQRIRADVQAAASLSHPNVMDVYDYGESVAADGSITSYVVTEPPSGRNLQRQLAGGSLPWPSARRVVADIAAALAELHAHGVVHGDLKPDNVVFTPTGAKATLIDFGTVSGPVQSWASPVTFGKSPYRAPEQARGEAAQPASDVYALAVMLYEALTGDLPWPLDPADERGETPSQYREPRQLPHIDGMPHQVADICRRCLAADPRLRPTSSEVALVLAAVADPADRSRRPT
jgi:transcriptional regulator with XRE-family HTH domain/tetratricopeptide (TPR) repeat protein